MKKITLLIHRGCGGGRGALNPLPLLPLKLRFDEDLLPFCGFSAGNRLLCGAIAASTGALWKEYIREWSKFLGGSGAASYGGGGGRVLPLPLVMHLVIFGSREKTLRLRSSAYDATANYSRAPSQSSHKSTTVNTMECCFC
jgi:hypothetical protein